MDIPTEDIDPVINEEKSGDLVEPVVEANAQPTAVITEDGVIQESTSIAEGTAIEDSNIVEDAAISESSIVPENTTISDVVPEGNVLPEGTIVSEGPEQSEGTVITEDNVIQQTTEIPEGTVISEGVTATENTIVPESRNVGESMPLVCENMPDNAEEMVANESITETSSIEQSFVSADTSTECELSNLAVEETSLCEESVDANDSVQIPNSQGETNQSYIEESQQVHEVDSGTEQANILIQHETPVGDIIHLTNVEHEMEQVTEHVEQDNLKSEVYVQEVIEASQVIPTSEKEVFHPQATITDTHVETIEHDLPVYAQLTSNVNQQSETVIPIHIASEEMDIREEIVKGHVKNEEIKIISKNIKSHMIENGKAIIEFDDASQESGTVVVVTADGTKELLLRPSDVQGLEDGSLTVQQVTDENGQIYFVETMDNVIVMEEDDETMENDNLEQVIEVGDQQEEIPVNIRGRNIENPAVDPLRNGKPPPKPRLGVKIPHRHLTSQIVSKQEIANEILERSWKTARYPAKQNIFAQKMTQTLAKKLAPSKKLLAESSRKSGSKKTPAASSAPKEPKLNNSDLIAILEGDSEPEPEPEVEPPPKKPDATMTRELEREIALRQLRELPDDPPAPAKLDRKFVKAAEEEFPEKVLKHLEESNPKKKRKVQDDTDDELPKNPRFPTNVPLKTYTRKRKPSDEAICSDKNSVVTRVNSENNSTKKIDLPMNANNYVTKSSRIIKKKIIWDPDEVSPRKMLKVDGPGKERISVLTSKNEKDTPTSEKRLEKEKRETVVKSERKAEEDKRSVEKSEVKKFDKSEQMKKVDSMKKVPSGTTKVDILKSDKRVIVKGKDMKPKVVDSKSPNDKLAAALKFKKRLTEVDKLLMDEGAVNMLYSFKNTVEDQTKNKFNKSLVSKTNELLNDLQTSTEKVSPKALRKKEGGVQINVVKSVPKKIGSPVPSSVTRQKSKDSNRSSGHSPPASPGPAFPAEASRIIRRHSSSSFSSLDEDEEEEKVPKSRKMDVRSNKKKSDVVVDGPKKKIKKEVEEVKETEKEKEKEKEKKNEEMSKTFNKLIDSEPEHVPRYDKYKMMIVNKFDQLIQIVIKTNKNDDLYFNIEVMQELASILKELETDADCNMVLVTSNAKKSFTNGTNFKIVVAQKEVTKKNLAKRLATNVRDFLLALANFPKVLVAGVHGKVIGLGVTMLPLFDIIIASESATFSTPYAQLGCMAEGGSLLALPHLSQNILVSELLYCSQVLKSDAALRLGLITRIVEDKEFQESLPCLLKEMSNQSAQFMEATKKQLRQRMIPDITATLNSETETLVQQWISPECQKNFSEKYSA